MLTSQQLSNIYEQFQQENASLSNELRAGDDEARAAIHKRMAFLSTIMTALLKYKKILDA